jgi:hypothetical protein
MTQREADTMAITKTREALATKHPDGYSDLAEWLVMYLGGEMSIEEFLWSCDVTYFDSNEPCPHK